ncbi:type IV pilus secretin PilQ [Pseudorhodoferax sp.]|uniref:type IV pilus secretin PilQ n=1 Tax=Pseudorhodoferax sp. TaxID=1993553 RepID=UPI002DD6384A|nr:type IV pilus secretin PilQ [Pseudorhodoferax sp.]
MNQHNHLSGIVARGAAALALALVSCGAWAVPEIKAVSGAVQNGSEIVRIDLTEAPTALPAGVSIQSPARIALDFAGVISTLPRTPVEINQGNLRSANVLSIGERSRVVLNLKQATSYKALLQGNSVLIVLDPVASALPANPAPVFPDAGAQGRAALRDLDFRRGADNAGRVIVGLGSSQVGVDLRQQGQTLVVEFLNSSLPEGLRRRLDVADFDTPVQSISTFQVGDRVRMVIEPRGNWEHSAYQSDGQFVVEVRPQRIDPNRLSQGPGFSGEKLSLNFQSIEVRALLQVIADFTNFNVVTSDSVTGSVTLRLKDVPWDQALQIIMDAKGLGMEKNGSVLWIAPKDEIDARKKKDLESAAALENLEPLRTQSFQMNYARAVDIAAQITNAGGGGGGGGTSSSRFLSSRGTAIPEPRTNQLFVTDVASRLEAVNELIKKLDVAVRQVLIEARIVEASDTFGKSIGVRLGGGDLRAQRGGDGGYRIAGNNRVAFGSSYSNAVASSGMGGTVNTSSNFVNLPAVAQGSAEEAASFAVSIFNSAANRFLSLELSALEADGKGKVVSSPRVVTADQTKALIEQGTELPYQVATSSGATSIAFRKANLKLEVTPQITPEGNIILDLDVNKDSVGQSTAAGFAINTKHIKTQVLVENGGTVVIGGIFELNEVEDVTKVPLLGDIPIAGNLFKSRTRTSNKQEMLIFITPKMIADRMAGR